MGYRLSLYALFATFLLLAAHPAGAQPRDARPRLPDPPFDYLDIGPLPGHGSPWTGATPPFTNAEAALGRVLFYDVRLSATDSVACATCHLQEHAFSDPRRFSIGANGEPTRRHSMALFNLDFHGEGFFWDLHAPTLDSLATMPIENPGEMNMDLDSLVIKMGGLADYPPLFAAAYGSPDITVAGIRDGLTAFLRSIVSNRSKYDRGLRNGFADFTSAESLGMVLFQNFAEPDSPERGANCFICHDQRGTARVIADFASIGLDQFPSDPGYGAVSGDSAHLGTFKVPSLRNVAFTAPYMHDGRFATLEAVIDHYDTGVQDHVNLSPFIRYLGNTRPMRLDLTPQEKAALVAFLHTLSDSALISDPRYSDPFADPTGSDAGPAPVPTRFAVAPAYPNPFNPATRIPVTLDAPAAVTLTVHDVLGRVVWREERHAASPGGIEFRWNGADRQGNAAASGIYLYRVTARSAGGAVHKATGRMLLLR